MKSSDYIITQDKSTGNSLTATQYMQIPQRINQILEFEKNTSDFLTMGYNAETAVGVGGVYIKNQMTNGNYGYAYGTGQMAVGKGARAFGWKCMAFGEQSWAGNLSATAFGHYSLAAGTHSVAYGRGAISFLANTSVIGPRNNNDFWIGSHQGLAYTVEDTDGNVFSIDSPADNWDNHEVRSHGADGKDWRDTPVYSNKRGGSIAQVAGRSTGTAKGGDIRNYVCPSGITTNNDLNPIVLASKYDSETLASGQTYFSLYVEGQGMKRIVVNGSGQLEIAA